VVAYAPYVSARVATVNVGSSEPNAAKRVGVTGIHKRPVDAALLRAPGPKHAGLGSGVAGDFIGDRSSHGGDRQAVYAFAREELDYWEERLGVSLANGSIGENLTTADIDVDAALIGDRWQVGDEVLLEVTGPRIPCATFAARMGVPGWLRTFSEVARSGAYLAVVTGGTVRPGDPIEVVHRSDHDVDVPTAFRAVLGDLDAAEHVVRVGCWPEDELDYLRDMLDRRRP
jgi:MOSC domain-containing protein YiiM